jgi:acyl-CoA synthetase (AMP-forming)/AMP-acid ligase II
MRVLGDLTRLQARRRPDKPALLFADAVVTYRAFDRRSNALANALVSAGIETGDRVAILAENSVEYAIATQAVAKAGAILLPLNFRLAPAELAYILGNAEPALVFVEAGHAAALDEAIRIAGITTRVVRLDVSDGGFEGMAAGASENAPTRPVDPQSAAIMMYTSGTTGFPKGVLYSHSNYFSLFDGLMVEGDFTPNDVVHLALPLFHNAGLNGALNTTLYAGGTTVIHRGNFDAPVVLTQIARHGVTVGLWVPTNLAILLDHPDFAKHDVSSLKKIFYGGMAIRTDLRERAEAAFAADFYQVYGSTECGNITVQGPQDHRDRPGVTGREFYNVEMRVVDDESREVGVGEVGEVHLRASDCGMMGYWRNDEATAKAMRDGWIHSGDLARVEEGGFITVVDRKKDMIISGGENVYPAEVEAVLHRHPQVAEAAVFGIPDAKYGETVCAAVVARPGSGLTADDIDAWCLQNLARYKRPRKVDFHQKLPRNVAGKVTKQPLRQPYWG